MVTKSKRSHLVKDKSATPSVDSEVLRRIVVLKSKHGVDITSYYQRIAGDAARIETPACDVLKFDRR